MRMLVIADTHIPDRAEKLKPYVENIIEEHKPYDIVVHAGDLTSKTILEWVKSLGKQCYVV
ncbi:MAG TPA: YfcE family phosphodiesterase, partial [Pyrodictium sp.]|nr:YfcE family phosphodiesterase [Pyrodictium sp.]